VDLENQEIIRPNGSKVSFKIDAYKKHCLLNGLDDIALTMSSSDQIDAFERERFNKFPWV
jgi:3-isopropylmalate dehydratase small subunit